MDILQAMEGESVVMELQEPLSPTLVLEENHRDYVCVVMPMRT